MHFHRFCDQDKTQPYVERSEQIRISGLHDVDFTHENKIVHHFHCLGDASASKAWTIVFLIGGMGWAIFFLQELVFAVKSFV